MELVSRDGKKLLPLSLRANLQICDSMSLAALIG